MRRVLLCDAVAAARVLAMRPVLERRGTLDLLLRQADAADRYARRFGRPHASWGNGSLMSRALADAPKTSTDESAFWESLSLVAAAIAPRSKPAP